MKLAATDYDGTFCPHGGDIPQENIEAVAKWQAAGHKFGLCTGRGIELVHLALQPHPDLHPDFVICNNGAVLFDHEEKLLLSQDMPSEVRAGILGMPLLSAKHHPLRVLTRDHMLTVDTGAKVEFGFPLELPAISIREAQQLEHVVQISLRCDTPEEALATSAIVKQKFPQIVGNINRNYIDFNMQEANKRDGLRNLLRTAGCQPENVFFIGDDRNDLLAIQYFHGYTVATAADFVKQEAAAVYQSVGDMLLQNI